MHVHLFAVQERFVAPSAPRTERVELIVARLQKHSFLLFRNFTKFTHSRVPADLQHSAGDKFVAFVAADSELGVVISDAVRFAVSENKDLS